MGRGRVHEGAGLARGAPPYVRTARRLLAASTPLVQPRTHLQTDQCYIACHAQAHCLSVLSRRSKSRRSFRCSSGSRAGYSHHSSLPKRTMQLSSPRNIALLPALRRTTSRCCTFYAPSPQRNITARATCPAPSNMCPSPLPPLFQHRPSPPPVPLSGSACSCLRLGPRHAD